MSLKPTVDLESETVSYFSAEMGLAGSSRELPLGICKLWQSHRQVSQIEDKGYFMEKEEVGRGCFE